MEQSETQSKKKILFVITKGNFGGAQRYVFDLATNLPRETYEIMAACGEGEELPNKLHEKGIETIRIQNLRREIKTVSEFKVCKELIQIIRNNRPDIIHLNSSKIGGIGAIAAKVAAFLEDSYNPRIIFTAHNWGFNEFWRPFVSKIFYYISHWITLLLCDQTIAVSQKVRKDVLWLPLVGKKITVVYNGIDKFETEEATQARLFLAGENDKPLIIYSISELHPTKGVDVALRAISELKEPFRSKVLYCIAGSGEWEQKLKDMVKSFGIQENVRFLGFVDNAKKYLTGCDIFLLPSRNEAFPYVILEAGIVGLPTIATSVGGIPEVIHDMKNGILVHKEKSKEIVNAITYLNDNENKRIEFARALKNNVSNNFSLEKMLQETTTVYSKLKSNI